MQIHTLHDGQQAGPYSLDEIRAQLAGGTLKLTDMAWYEGAPDWMAVSLIPGVGAGAPPSMPPVMPRQMPFVPLSQKPQTSGLAIASMVLGLMGFFFGFLTGIPAVICGHMALSRIKQAAGTLTGRGLAITGLVTGYLGIFLLVVVAVLAAIALPVFRNVQVKAQETKALSDGKQIALACRLYASDNNGNFPDTLEQLVPTYVQDRKIFVCAMDPTHAPIGYDYFGGKDSDPPDKILLQSKAVLNHKRVVVHCDGSGMIQSE